jgi:hypothetical protein
MSSTSDGNARNTKVWLVVMGLVFTGLLAFRVANPPAEPPPPAPPPTSKFTSGRWLDTEFAGGIIQFSPAGEIAVANRGVPFLLQGTYEYANGKLEMKLNDFEGQRTIEFKVLSLSRSEMEVSYRPLFNLGGNRKTTYWRIDPQDYSPLRAKLIGKWERVDIPGAFIEFQADDTFRQLSRGVIDTGIFRVIDKLLEYHIGGQETPVSRYRIVDVTESELLIHSETQNKDLRYGRVVQ